MRIIKRKLFDDLKGLAIKIILMLHTCRKTLNFNCAYLMQNLTQKSLSSLTTRGFKIYRHFPHYYSILCTHLSKARLYKSWSNYETRLWNLWKYLPLLNLFMFATMLRVRGKNYGKYGHNPSSFFKREENLMLRVKSFLRACGLMLIYVRKFWKSLKEKIGKSFLYFRIRNFFI